jgi:23S rRNA pseudouridine1911/1915/1917 synthase
VQEKIIYKKLEFVRVDVFLAAIYKDYSRSYFQRLADKQKIFVNGKTVLSSKKLKYADEVLFEFENEEKIQNIQPEKIEINTIYEDDAIIIVNKQPGIVVHPSFGHETGTLLNGLAARAGKEYSPYLVHRLDKDTSGIIIFAKNEKAKISLSKQFQKRAVKKVYCAAVKGIIAEDKGRIEAPLGREPNNRKIMSVNPLAKKMAVTEFKVLARKDGYTLLEINIITGRTHQIRSHMKYINHPVIGDRQYGGPETVNGVSYKRQMLHSRKISFTHPQTAKPLHFTAELPKDLKQIFKI